MMSEKYFGFNDRLDVARQFEEGTGDRWDRNVPYVPAKTFPTERQLLIALYDGGGYDGTAFVLFKQNGKLYEVNASHCSCYGLEGQWSPDETSWEALAVRKRMTYDEDREFTAAMKALVKKNVDLKKLAKGLVAQYIGE